MKNRNERIKLLRETFPVGTKIQIDKMYDDRAIAENQIGIVSHIDDYGTIHCIFDNGRVLGVIDNLDLFHKIDE